MRGKGASTARRQEQGCDQCCSRFKRGAAAPLRLAPHAQRVSNRNAVAGPTESSASSAGASASRPQIVVLPPGPWSSGDAALLSVVPCCCSTSCRQAARQASQNSVGLSAACCRSGVQQRVRAWRRESQGASLLE
jgi:hypothetical protein